tara:strand:+ start:285 stop:1316 length:1032 start_codon:yes stop_codon:yes gene_type:complete
MLAVLSTFPTACFAGVTPLRRQRVDRVAVVGGTHGNELLGVQIVNQLLRQPDEAERSTFETVCVIANPEAVAENRRYCTIDLNRCFDATALQAAHSRRAEGVEPARARELNEQLGPKGSASPLVDMCLDVHTTTSSMGISLMMAREDALAVELAAFLRRRVPSVRIVFWQGSRATTPTLPSVSRSGMTIEVGALPQGVCTAESFHETRRLVRHALDWLDARNRKLDAGTLRLRPVCVTAFQRVCEVPYPRDEDGELAALVHPTLQSRDFRPMRAHVPAFSRLHDGASLHIDADTWRAATARRAWWAPRSPPLFPIFVNEAAYYEKDVAFVLAKKVKHVVDLDA